MSEIGRNQEKGWNREKETHWKGWFWFIWEEDWFLRFDDDDKENVYLRDCHVLVEADSIDEMRQATIPQNFSAAESEGSLKLKEYEVLENKRYLKSWKKSSWVVIKNDYCYWEFRNIGCRPQQSNLISSWRKTQNSYKRQRLA